MEGMARSAPVLQYVAEVAPQIPFTLVDVGCSGGIELGFRRFGKRLRALAVDPNVAEIDRLRTAETHSGISYVAAFAGLPKGHPFIALKGNRDPWGGRSPWFRLSVSKSLEALEATEHSAADHTRANPCGDIAVADETPTLVLPDYLREKGMHSVDFLKIDVDGKDFEVLHSFETALEELGILAVGMEVNFCGSEAPTDHTFHNTDRFMRAKGFALLNLTVRRYSMAALPSRYISSGPAQSELGRVFQGDALYARDLGSPEQAELAARLGPRKLLNLVCLFASFNLPDCAAEIVVQAEQGLASFCDTSCLLDLLAAQMQGASISTLPYREFMRRFEGGDRMFFANPVNQPRAVA